MSCVVGIDLGTSAVKAIAVNHKGEVQAEVSKEYPIYHPMSGYSEQDPEDWVNATVDALTELNHIVGENTIEGVSFSGQMHGLVLLDQNMQVLRPAILWNDTRTTKQCRQIEEMVPKEKLLSITKNPALEGFTLPKILWVKENEFEIYQKASVFLLPKDYVRYRLTGEVHMDLSDAAGTLLLDIKENKWSEEIANETGIDTTLFPPLVHSSEFVGLITEPRLAMLSQAMVFAGGADNACGAIGAGIHSSGKTMCSIGTSGVILTYEERSDLDFNGKVHYFNHAIEDKYYTMGVTLSAGHSLNWFRNQFAEGTSFDELLSSLSEVPPGANGLIFTPYLSGERSPHADATIRGSFIGMDASHKRGNFLRAVIEGITFSLNESVEIFRENGKVIEEIVSIGGGAKNEEWLQIQADIFNARIVKYQNEEGPAMGAAMLAAYGVRWFHSIEECSQEFLEIKEEVLPIKENVMRYKELFSIYQSIYATTKTLNEQLASYR